MRKLEKNNSVLDDATKKEWVDDEERRLRDILTHVKPRPMISGYSMERSDDVLTVYTITLGKVVKREIGLLSAGDWPCWNDIVKALPEVDTVFRYEWSCR